MKILKVLGTFCLAKIGEKHLFGAVLDRKQAFLDYKNISFMKAAKLTFSKGKVRGLGENVKFIHPFFLGKISLEKVIGAVLDRKEAIQTIKTSI